MYTSSAFTGENDQLRLGGQPGICLVLIWKSAVHNTLEDDALDPLGVW